VTVGPTVRRKRITSCVANDCTRTWILWIPFWRSVFELVVATEKLAMASVISASPFCPASLSGLSAALTCPLCLDRVAGSMGPPS